MSLIVGGLTTALVLTILIVIGLIVGLFIEANKTIASPPQVNPYEYYKLSEDIQAAANLSQKLQLEIAHNGLDQMKIHMHTITKKVL
jgi:hypothetical protein